MWQPPVTTATLSVVDDVLRQNYGVYLQGSTIGSQQLPSFMLPPFVCQSPTPHPFDFRALQPPSTRLFGVVRSPLAAMDTSTFSNATSVPPVMVSITSVQQLEQPQFSQPCQPPQQPTPLFRPATPSGQDGSQTSIHSYTDLTRTVEKLRQEVDALRGLAPDPNISPRAVSAFRWIQVDRHKYDDICVVNFEVLNRA